MIDESMLKLYVEEYKALQTKAKKALERCSSLLDKLKETNLIDDGKDCILTEYRRASAAYDDALDHVDACARACMQYLISCDLV